jgi:hypothetical protein
MPFSFFPLTMLNNAAGVYVGDGTASKHIMVGFKPSAVIIINPLEAHVDFTVWNAINQYAMFNSAQDQTGGILNNTSYIPTGDGFTVGYTVDDQYSLNLNGETYQYIAFRWHMSYTFNGSTANIPSAINSLSFPIPFSYPTIDYAIVTRQPGNGTAQPLSHDPLAAPLLYWIIVENTDTSPHDFAVYYTADAGFSPGILITVKAGERVQLNGGGVPLMYGEKGAQFSVITDSHVLYQTTLYFSQVGGN